MPALIPTHATASPPPYFTAVVSALVKTHSYAQISAHKPTIEAAAEPTYIPADEAAIITA